MASKKYSLKLFLLIAVISFPYKLNAQKGPSDFLVSLIQGGEYQMALQWMDEMNTYGNSIAEDSLSYYKGLALYYLKDLSRANDAWARVEETSVFYQPANLFYAWNLAYIGDMQGAEIRLGRISGRNQNETDLIRLEQLGVAILSRNESAYNLIHNTTPVNSSLLITSAENLEAASQAIKAFKPKSLWVAGLSSAIIPGLGKMYAGETATGISSLLLVGALGAMTVENGLKSGWTHWNTLLFGGLFLIFHAGNIYGSLMSVKEYRNRFNEQIDQNILWDMHMPLRDYYR